MEQELLGRLGTLIDRLLKEHAELKEQNRALTEQRDRLFAERTRVSKELDKLLDKVNQVAGDNR